MEIVAAVVLLVLVGVIFWARKADPRRRGSERQQERAREAYARDVGADRDELD